LFSVFLYFWSNNFISSWFVFFYLSFILLIGHSYFNHGLELRNLFSIVLFFVFAKFTSKSSFRRLYTNLTEIICELLLFTICLSPRMLFFGLSILSDSMFALNSEYFSLCHLFLFFFFNNYILVCDIICIFNKFLFWECDM
jgi:hypothetical protein